MKENIKSIMKRLLDQQKLLLVLMLIFCSVTALHAQQRTVSGTVTDENGEPIAGATVLVEGTYRGVSTDPDGNFEIAVNPEDSYLHISFVGMKELRLELGDASEYDVSLEYDVLGLDEVVVVGYGTQKKGDVTSAISSVKADEFVKGANVDAAQLVQGKVAGLAVVMPDGDPTSGSQIMLRGTSSLKGGSTPLVLINGVPGSLQTVAPEDIESIDVLKDGSAAAIYGTRGTNGVVIITTKSSQYEAEPEVEYTGYTSVSHISNNNKADFMLADDLRQRWDEGYSFTGANLEDFGESTDWVNEITRTGITHSHNVSLRGGSKTSNYVASVNYRDQKGTFIGTNNNTINGRLDLNHMMFDGKLKFNLSTILSEQKYDANGDGYGFNTRAYRYAVNRNPTEPIYDDGDAKWFERNVYRYDNPVALIEETIGQNLYRRVRFSGSVIYSPVPGLDIKGMYTKRGNSEIRGYYETKDNVSTTKYGRNGYASRGANDYINDLGEITVTYNKSYGDHRINALAGYSYESQTSEGFWMQNWDFPTDAFSYNNMGTGFALTRGEAPHSSSKSMQKLIGFFARVSYNYADKYMAMLSMRREGSSKFGEDNKWGNFPGISLGWKIDNEPFMENAVLIDNLKLRAGFGITGIDILSPYQSLSSLDYSTGAAMLYNGTWVYGLTPSRNPNPNLRWERKEEYNIGLDFSFAGGRIGGSVDAYTRLTKDMLWDYSVPVPPYLFGTITANVGQIRNRGIEVLLNFVPVRSANLEWRSDITYSTNSNKLISLNNEQFQTTNDFFYAGHTGEPIQTVTHRIDIGGPIGNFWGLKVVDIDEDGIWIVETPDGELISAADASDADKQVLGNGLPSHYLSFNNSFTYKGFDLNINMRGAFGFQILNFQRMYYENPTINYNMLNSAFDEVYGKEVLQDVQRFVSYYIEQGDYMKLDNITLGYTFNTDNLNAVKRFRVYVSGRNLATITGYKGMDPEVNIRGLSPGNDSRDKYPTVTSYTFGINLTF
ncbi:MAG: SusC/RagA family TonB-linked outer membrane protein [Bacteroidales bacterium]|nr:SusC/RagA family TonB-linked outer membrane protein [Bacteroidales bacterium]